jgi:hypothetical protein
MDAALVDAIVFKIVEKPGEKPPLGPIPMHARQPQFHLFPR